ncbi:MAG TPA: ribosome maturation factor RimM [Ilumatobacteraceae bacterium]|nr:ribosome maturation factor RimM [Ilumatobacteraceae bacterium]
MSTDDLREVGRIGRAHGVNGQVYVSLLTDRVERLAPGARLLAGDQWLTVAESRQQQQRWLVRFEGLVDRTAAERLTNSTLMAEPLTDDHDDALWVHDLIGSKVVDQHGVDRGTCVAVIDNPAHDMMELDSGALVPVTFVVDCRDGIATVDTPEGLFDL